MRLLIPLLICGACGGPSSDCEPDDKVLGWIDADADGFGGGVAVKVCAHSLLFVANSDDCNDDDPLVSPFGDESCNGVDDDCDGRIDERFAEVAFYADADADGYGDPDTLVYACEAPPAHVQNPLDCNDDDPSISPDAQEVCGGADDDCDGAIDDDDDSLDTYALTEWFVDDDGDGFGDPDTSSVSCTPLPDGVEDGTDCDDTRGGVNPGQPEVCNGADDNCDTLIDDDDPTVDPATQTTWYLDGDGDGLGDAATATVACAAPADHRTNDQDCDDSDPLITVARNWLLDGDGDGFGAGSATVQCTPPTPNHVLAAAGIDCDDAVAAVFPGQLEVCNAVDDDCDGLLDDADPSTDLSTGIPLFADADGDGFGSAASPLLACAIGPGRTDDDTDCSDGNPDVHPGAAEVCNGADDDCDTLVDDDDPDIDPLTLRLWYLDADADGVGDLMTSAAACEAPLDHVVEPTDCDDADPAVGAPGLWLEDADGDGIGAGVFSGPSCSGPDATWVDLFLGEDCDDADDTVFPGALDVCGDGLDQDCSGSDTCGFADDFEVQPLDPTVWVGLSGDADLTNAESASGAWSVNLAGGGGSLTSAVLDTASCASVGWSYAGKRGPESPDPAEFLRLEWWDGGSWITADAWEGNAGDDAGFSTRAGEILDPAALHAGFQVRFRSNGSGLGFDDFYLDDVAIDCL